MAYGYLSLSNPGNHERIDEVIQGDEDKLRARVTKSLVEANDTVALRKWEQGYNLLSDIEINIELAKRILSTNNLFY